MAALPSELRNRLENTVKAARRQAEAAAKAALERLTVGNAEPGGHLSVEERQLRNRLRAHGRQLGDQRDAKTGTQSTSRLIHECAYEHWHRMLFARFLAENNLLIHEKEGMPVTLAECDELAADEGAPDGWTLAARYAARMLPQIFRPDDPVLQVGFAPEHKRGLEKLVTELAGDVFTAEDSLGWVYQFWQAERKDEVNASGDKITGETLPAVTQLFTEHYMVLFLLHNTVGAWWAAKLKAEGRIPKSEWGKCQTEDDCRKLVALPGYEFTYLRFIKDGSGEWVPSAGGFPGWPRLLKDFKLLDPCCGSGHFLVAAFVLMVLMRMQDEKLSTTEASDAVLRENLHGLELDPRCTQIAAFALALAAWKLARCYRPLPSLNIACSGIGVDERKEVWLALANGDEKFRWGMARLHELFLQAPDLGSLIDPRSAPGFGSIVAFSELEPLLARALDRQSAKRNDEAHEMAVAAQGIAQAAKMLAEKYHCVLTNVPYLSSRRQSKIVQAFCALHHAKAKTNLATAFVQRCLAFCHDKGVCALVTPQNWLFLGDYASFRAGLLRRISWEWIARLGPRAFETISGEVVNVVLMTLLNEEPPQSHSMWVCDAAEIETSIEKAVFIREGPLQNFLQSDQSSNPDSRVCFAQVEAANLLESICDNPQGIKTGDDDRWRRAFWEVESVAGGWEFYQSTVETTRDYGGREHIIDWRTGGAGMVRPRVSNTALGRLGIAISQVGQLPATLYTGERFDSNVAAIVPNDPNLVAALWAFGASPDFAAAVRRIDQSLKVTNNTLVKIPFDLPEWHRVAAEQYQTGLPKPDSCDPTQWLFEGHPPDSAVPLHVGAARLLGYRWPRQTGQTVSGAAPVLADGLEKFVDEDGIVCIPSVRGEAPAPERLRSLLALAYGNEWSPAILDELLSAVDYAGSNLEDWLRNGFFDQHCKLFHHRPFIWQIWDGCKDGFSALVNYHKLDHKLLEKLTYTYLGEWIKKQQDAVADEQSGADDCLLKAQQLQEKLKLILEGEKPFDIFVRWKPLEQQPIGWNPDLNDGVRLNIRPFVEADVLRKRPKIKWGVDRGKNPPGSPWGEERDNDRHLTLAEKQHRK